MKKTIIFTLTFVSMLMNVNAQTCNAGLENIVINPTGNMSEQTGWETWHGQVHGNRWTANKSGTATAIGVIVAFGLNSADLEGVVYNASGAKVSTTPVKSGGHGISSGGWDTLYLPLPCTICPPLSTANCPFEVVYGQDYFIGVRDNHSEGLIERILFNPNDSSGTRFRFASPWDHQLPSNLPDNTQFEFLDDLGPEEPVQGQGFYGIFLVIEDCVEPVCTNANTFETVQSGDADDEDTWLDGNIPNSSGCVIINDSIHWNISSPLHESFTVNHTFTISPLSSIKTKSLVDNVGQNFTGTVELTADHVNVSGTGGASKFEKLIVTANTLSFSKASEVFYLELASDVVVQSTNLLMKGKVDIPPNIYWYSNDVSFTGPVTIDESFTIFDTPVSGNGSWRIQGSPGTGLTILDWSNDTLNPGHHTCGYSGADYPLYNFKSPGFYDETMDDPNVDVGWIFPPGGNDASLDKGFYAYYNSTVMYPGNAPVYTTRLSPVIVTTDVTFDNLTYTNSTNPLADGWHLLKNPFPCSVDINQFDFVNVEKVIYTWDHHCQNDETWNVQTGCGTGGRTNALAAGQGFWVKVVADSIGELTIPVSAMIPTTNLEYRSGETAPPIELVLTSQNERSFNALVIPWTDGDLAYTPIDAVCKDASSSNGNVSIYTMSSDGIKLSQNVVPANQTIILDVAGSSPTPNGQNTLTVNVNPLYQNWCLAIDWLGDDTEEWIPVTDGEVLVIPSNLQQHSQVTFAKLKMVPQTEISLSVPNELHFFWEPFETSINVALNAEGNFTNISWMFSNGDAIYDHPQINAIFDSPQVETIIVTATNGCGMAEETITITIECTPMTLELGVPDYIFLEIAFGENIPEIHLGVDAEGEEAVVWNFGDETPNVTGSSFVTHTYDLFGIYTAEVQTHNACGVISEEITIEILEGEEIISVDEIKGDLLLSIYPIPNDGSMVSIVTSGYGNEPLYVDIINSVGAVIQREVLVGGSNSGSKRLYFNQVLSSGVYFVKVYNSQNTSTKQLVVK